MKSPMMVLLGLTLAAGLAITGCKKDDASQAPGDQAPAGVTNEQTAMSTAALSDEFTSNDEQAFADNKLAPTDYDESVSKVDTAISPLRWGRFITSVTRNVTLNQQPGDTVTVATVTRTIVGTLKIKTTINGVDSIISKPFTDKSVKNVIFYRVANDMKHYWKNWMPVATSLVAGATDPTPANEGIQLTKVEIVSDTNTLSITDPASFWLRYKWLNYFKKGGKADVPTFSLGVPVTIRATVMSQSADTDLVAIRHGFGLHAVHYQRARMAMTSQSGPDANGFYTRTYEKTIQPKMGVGYFHIGIDAVTRATLYDSQAPYSVSWWGVPYRMF